MKNSAMADFESTTACPITPRSRRPSNADKSLPLVELTGAGIVEWWKLKASNKVLSEDNLWLQVTVDGEAKPALEAPARFFFPGLPNQRNYQNFVATQRNGFINLLAMPYSSGLKVAAVNHGKKAIKDIALTLSTEVFEDASKVPPLRLRGEFAAQKQPEIVSRSGRGRWIGLIYELGQDPLPEVAGLVVDGQPQRRLVEPPAWPRFSACRMPPATCRSIMLFVVVQVDSPGAGYCRRRSISKVRWCSRPPIRRSSATGWLCSIWRGMLRRCRTPQPHPTADCCSVMQSKRS